MQEFGLVCGFCSAWGGYLGSIFFKACDLGYDYYRLDVLPDALILVRVGLGGGGGLWREVRYVFFYM